MIRLLHLSDIHFSKRSGTHYDLDKHVRDLLIVDLKQEANLGVFSGCVITGDIAFSGKDNEYKTALEFLTTLSQELNFPLGAIWIVPGNHDYDRKIASDSKMLKELTAKLRKINDNEINKEIEEFSISEDYKDKLYSPLFSYNEFARQFNCDISSDKSFWDIQIPFPDYPDTFLYIRGLNSVLISSSEDSDKNDNMKMVMSLRQCQQKPTNDGIKISLCHHPFSWIRNSKELQRELGNSFHVQLFGHEHEPRIDKLNDSVLVHAGAIHPERNEGAAVPSYNILEFSFHQEAKVDIIKLKTKSRAYDFKDGTYKTIEPKQGPDYRHEFTLNKRSPTAQINQVTEEKKHEVQKVPSPDLSELQAIRTLQVRFYGLSFFQQFEILQNLKIVKDDDSELLEQKKFGPFFHRARDAKLLHQMWEMVEQKRASKEKSNNPFQQV